MISPHLPGSSSVLRYTVEDPNAHYHMATPAAPSIVPAGFSDIWKAALMNYKSETSRDLLLDSPASSRLQNCNTVDALAEALREHTRSFKEFRDGGKKIRQVLTPIVRLALLFADSGAEAAATSVNTPMSGFGFI
jgi:hypothetical protein